MEDQNQSYSVKAQVSQANACLLARPWRWLAVAFVLGGLVGVYQPQQPALLPDELLSGSALVLAVLGSLALDRRVLHKALVLPSTLGMLLLGMGVSSLALVGSGLFLPIATPPRLPPVFPCGGVLLPHGPLGQISRLAGVVADVEALPLGWFVFLLFLFPALMSGLTATLAAWSVGTMGEPWRATRTLARWCGVAAWLGIGLHNGIYLQLALPPGPPCPELQDVSGWKGPTEWLAPAGCAFLLVGLPLALFGGALGAFLRLRMNRLYARGGRGGYASSQEGERTW